MIGKWAHDADYVLRWGIASCIYLVSLEEPFLAAGAAGRSCVCEVIDGARAVASLSLD